MSSTVAQWRERWVSNSRRTRMALTRSSSLTLQNNRGEGVWDEWWGCEGVSGRGCEVVRRGCEGMWEGDVSLSGACTVKRRVVVLDRNWIAFIVYSSSSRSKCYCVMFVKGWGSYRCIRYDKVHRVQHWRVWFTFTTQCCNFLSVIATDTIMFVLPPCYVLSPFSFLLHSLSDESSRQVSLNYMRPTLWTSSWAQEKERSGVWGCEGVRACVPH